MALHCTMQNIFTFYQDPHFSLPNPELSVKCEKAGVMYLVLNNFLP